MRKCDACGSDDMATVSTKYEGNYTECIKCGKRTYIPSYEELVYHNAKLEAYIDKLEGELRNLRFGWLIEKVKHE